MDTEANKTEVSNFCVAVRLRPFLPSEKLSDSNSIVSVSSDVMLVFDPADDIKSHVSGSTMASLQKIPRQPGTHEKLNKAFVFDRVFDQDSSQDDVFDLTVKPLVKHAISGYNSTVLAYGATGAGKTFTMMGTKAEPGIMSRALDELYSLIDEDLDYSHSLLISMLEIYNEEVRDLLLPRSQQKKLNIRDHQSLGPHVPGLTEISPLSIEHAKTTLEKGINNRVMAATGANTESSRSHALFLIRIHSTPRNGGVDSHERTSLFTLIDLAGSERVSRTSNTGLRLVEGSNINKSLLALGNCINILCKASANNPDKAVRIHVPYRDSKLTYLLKNSLGGNCKTLMISNLSPSKNCYEDTFNTLQYANRAKNIKCSVQRNEMSVIYNISQYRKIIERVTAENTKLKEQLFEIKKTEKNENWKKIWEKKDQLLPQIRDTKNILVDSQFRIRKIEISLENPENFLEEKFSQKEISEKIISWKENKSSLQKTIQNQENRIKILEKDFEKLKNEAKNLKNSEFFEKFSSELKFFDMQNELNYKEKVIEFKNWSEKVFLRMKKKDFSEISEFFVNFEKSQKIENFENFEKIKKILQISEKNPKVSVPSKVMPKKVTFVDISPEKSLKTAPAKHFAESQKDWNKISQKFSALQNK